MGLEMTEAILRPAQGTKPTLVLWVPVVKKLRLDGIHRTAVKKVKIIGDAK